MSKANPPSASAFASRKSTVAPIESAAASLFCGHNKKVCYSVASRTASPPRQYNQMVTGMAWTSTGAHSP
jgi:hypothetical protein